MTHGIYVWSAYGCVLLFLITQWLLPWRKWRHYLKQLSAKNASRS